MNEQLTDSNFALYAARHYDNPACFDTDEFNEDLQRFKYLKRLFNQYRETGILKERLILNHLIILVNVFGAEMATQLLMFRLHDYAPILKPFLILLSAWPQYDNSRAAEQPEYVTQFIPLDDVVVQRVRKIV